MENISEATLVESPAESGRDQRRLRWFEVLLVLAIVFGSSIFSSLHILIGGQTTSLYRGNLGWLSGFVHEAASLFLVGYILARRKLRFADLGFRWSFRDAGMGLAVTVVSYFVYWVGDFLVYMAHRAFFASAHSGLTAQQAFGHPTALAIPFVLLNPFFEELIVRAYVMSEVKELTGSWMLAGALSLAVQFSYHLYYGWEGATTLAFEFLVFAIFYSRTRRITPVIVAHGIFDIYGLMRLW